MRQTSLESSSLGRWNLSSSQLAAQERAPDFRPINEVLVDA